MVSSFDQAVKKAVPSVFNMISSSADHQQSEEAYNTGKFELPNPAGKQGGACTSAFLQQQYENGNGLSWVETLRAMREVLKSMGYKQEPQLTSSRMIDVSKPMQIVPKGSGRRRALLIGINYVGQKGQLTACHNDCKNVREYLIEVHGFNEDEMLILMDDGKHQPPTRKNIEEGFCLLTKYSQPGDVVFVSYSGHGGRTEDLDGDEDDGYDETLIPVDFQTEGQIIDDDILRMLVKPMRAGVTTTVLMDCCHSGTVLDLPYKFGADDKKAQREEGFNMEPIHEAVRTPPEKRRKDDAQREKIRKTREKQRKEEEDIINPEQPLGPKLAPNGQPVLPVRAARPSSSSAPGNQKQVPPAPPSQCCVIL